MAGWTSLEQSVWSVAMWLLAQTAIVACVIAAGLALTACSTPWDQAAAAFDRGDYETAIRLTRPLADQGDPDAQYALGVVYMIGIGVPEDFPEAVRWYRKAADQGKIEAQTNLGIMYREGRGVTQDHAEAAKWYRLAAERGDPDAQHNLGMAYERGQGVPQDDIQAHMWFSIAASRYSDPDQQSRIEPIKKYREDSVMSRDELAARMTAAQIAEAKKLAREWNEKPRPP